MISIREAQESEGQFIADFQLKMAKETENLALDPETVNSGVQYVFDNPVIGKYFVFLFDQKVIGSALTLFEWSDWRNGNVIWIHSVYVEKEQRRKGVFKTFYQHLKSLVETDDSLKGLRLYVDKTNKNAIQVYESLGMTAQHYDLFEWLPGY